MRRRAGMILRSKSLCNIVVSTLRSTGGEAKKFIHDEIRSAEKEK
jgi:hypothetical protein